MQDKIEMIREQLHEIRNIFSPIELKLTELEEKLGEVRASLGQTDSTSIENSAAIEDIEEKSLHLLERVMRIEQELNIRPKPARKGLSRAHDSGPLSERF